MSKAVTIVGGLLCLMGLAVLIGWWSHVEMLVRVVPGTIAMTPNTALCFVLTGGALVAARVTSGPSRMLQTGLAVATLAIATITLSQHIFGFDAGIDKLLCRIWLVDSNIFPGRMAPQTMACFMVASLLMVLINSRFSMLKDGVIHVLLILLGAMGVIGVAGYVFDLSLLYSWYQHTAIAPHTALGFILLTVGLWCAWLAQRAQHQALVTASVQPLGLAPFSLVIVATLASGLFSFVAMVTQTELLQRSHLNTMLRLQTNEVKAELDAANALSALIANRPHLNQQISAFNQGSGGDASVRAIAQVANSFISNNITGLSIQALNGQLIAQAGEFQKSSDFNAVLDYQSRLLWNDALFVRRSINLVLDGQAIGTALVEIRLPGIKDVLNASAGIGGSAETVICISFNPSTMQCIPSRHRSSVFKVLRSSNGRALPMEFALDRSAGSITARDYRQQEVLAAYNHLTPYPLGIVTKVDTAELYAPIRKLFQIYFALLIAFVVIIVIVYRFRTQSRSQPG